MTKNLTDYFYGNPKAILLTGLISILLVALGLYFGGLNRNGEYYNIQFEQVDWLKEGDKVVIKGLVVGEVRDLRIDDEKKVLVTIWVGRGTKVTEGSTFSLRHHLLGDPTIEIALSDSHELLDKKQILKGEIQPFDSTGIRKWTAEERDSLIKHDPMYKLADTLLIMLRNSKDSSGIK